MIACFVRHSNAANLLMAAIVLLGVATLPGLLRETFPEIENDKVEIRVVYKGATTAEVEDAICRRLEDALNIITNLDETRCEAQEGLGIATAVMDEGADMQRFLDDVKSEIDAIDDFPDQAEQPRVQELGRTDAVVSIAITGPDNPTVLKTYAEDVKSRLQRLREISGVSIKGFSTRQIRVEVPAGRLRQFGLSAQDIAMAIERQSVQSPAGELQGQQEDVLLRFDDRRESAAELGNLIVISGATGAAIRLGDIAQISDRFERDEVKILFNDRRAAVLDITKTRTQDTLRAFDTVQAFVAAENAAAPAGVELSLTQDRASIVRERLNMLVSNGIQGLIAVFLVLWLFFNLRFSFWVTMGLPVSFLGALFVMPMLGISINMISMVGLLIGIGLLMDDAIVIAENIGTRRARGDSAMQAAINGARQVAPGVLSSFATTLLVFGSLAFITGEVGQILRIMPIVLILVLSVSLVEAFLILPRHLGHSLAHASTVRSVGFRVHIDSAFAYLKDRLFGGLADRAIEYRYATVGIVLMLVLLALAIPVGGKLKFTGFPSIEGDVIEARVLLPQGTPLARTEAIIEQLQSAARELNETFKPAQPQRQDLVKNITVLLGENPDAFETGPHVARVVVDLLSSELRRTSLNEFRRRWRDSIGALPDIITLKFAEPTVGPGGRAIDIRVSGPDLDRIKAAALDLRTWFNGFAGVIDLGDDLRPGKREYDLTLKDSAGVLGLDARAVAAQLRAAMQGYKVDEFPRGAERYEVDVRLPASDRADIEALERLSIVGPEGALIPIRVIADITETRGWARIQRINGQRTVSVQGDVDRDRANAQELLQLAGSEILPLLQQRYPMVRVDVQGQSAESAKTSGSIVRNVLLGMVGVYMLLALQFHGYVAPVTIMSVIPTSLIGVILGHLALGLDLTLPSMIGMASLFGVVVNDSILLVVFMRNARATGTTVVEAAREAARARFRPILLTSVTTIAGLLPLLMETSLQAQILIPLAVSLAFGMTSATACALILVPALYCILDDFGVLGAVEPSSPPQHE